MFARLTFQGQRLLQAAYAPADIALLVWFRIAFGLILAADTARHLSGSWIQKRYIEPVFHFKYYGFSWVQAWPGWGMYLHFAVMGLAACGIALGLFYRVSVILFSITFSYACLVDQANYFDRFYLVALFSFLLCFMPAARVFSLDSLRRPSPLASEATVSAWTLWALRGQMCIMYFFAGIAKLDPDWLQGSPMREWLRQRSYRPWVGPWFAQEWTPLVFSYAGLALDLLAGPLLFWHRSRTLMLIALTGFHLANHALFGSALGLFPWLSLAATVVLFAQRLPRPWLKKTSPDSASIPVGRSQPGSVRQTWGMVLLAGFFLVQVVMPLRHWAYGGYSPWTQEGHRFAWRMMLFRRSGVLVLKVRDPGSGETWEARPEEFLTTRQAKEVRTMPDMILQLCHYAKARYEALGHSGLEIRVQCLVSHNERPHQLLIDPEVDLTKVERSLLPASWILPWQPTPLPKQPLQDHLGDRHSAND